MGDGLRGECAPYSHFSPQHYIPPGIRARLGAIALGGKVGGIVSAAQPADATLRERLDEVLHELAADELEPARVAVLQLEADKLRKLLRVCFQHERNQ